MKHLEKALKYARADMFVPFELTNEILNKTTATGSFAVLMSYEMIPVLQQRGVGNITLLVNKITPRLNSIAKFFGCNITTLETNLKFDVVIGNPPYNVSEKKSVSGTGGNVNLYRHFFFKSLEMIRENGTISLITPKGIIRNLIDSENFQTTHIDLMTKTDYWKFNTLWFVGTKKQQIEMPMPSDKIFNKIFSLEYNKKYYSMQGNINKNNLSENEGVFSVIKLPSASNEIEYGYVKKETSKILYGPKVCATILENRLSYVVTEVPLYASNAAAFSCETIEDAQKMFLFIQKNKLLKFAHKKLKTKGLFVTLRHLKEFDLSQIKTGYEYPKEWGLTAEEIEYVESNC